MAFPDVEAEFKGVFNAASAILKDAGYRKRGTSFRMESDGNLRIINFQRSSESSASAIKFTVNIGVVSSTLLRKRNPEKELLKENIWSAHLRVRIGCLTPAQDDRWWTVTSVPVSGIKEELAHLIATQVIPLLQQHTRDSDLVALWKTGRSPGLTEGQRIRNLAVLDESR